MNELSIGSKETMTSREIAEVTGKEHKSVMRDIRVLEEQKIDGYRFVPTSLLNVLIKQTSRFNELAFELVNYKSR